MTPDANWIVWLFGKPYWWQRQGAGQLALQPATWMTEPERPVVNIAYWGDAAEFAQKIARAVREATLASGS